MSDFEEKIQTAFSNREPRVVHVPEWGEDLYIYPLTLLQLEEIYADDNDYRVALRTILVRAKRSDGSPRFDKADFEKFRKWGVDDYGPAVIAKVAQQINSPEDKRKPDEIVADNEKN